jgi:anaerobic magnesium-protoporphyrin IX monomethyl ester cyclase
MRILLINPTTRLYGQGIAVKAQAPLALLCLAAVLREHGHTVKIFDHNVEERGLKDCFKFEPELIGITSFTGPMILDALRLSEIFRTRLGVPIVWGGVHPSLLPTQTVSDPRVDMCVVGEGEETIVELADCIEKQGDLSQIKGLVLKKPNNGTGKIIINPPRPFIRDLDALPFPAWDLIDEKKYLATSIGIEKSSVALFSIQSSRGCPYQCGFCYNSMFNQRTWRFKSADRVIEEIQFLKDKYHMRAINFRDDNFVVNKKRAEAICKGIYRNKLNIRFAVDCRVDLFTLQLARYLDLAGCSQIFFGVESGSPRILRFVNKGISLTQAVNAVKICRQLKIRCSASFVIGFPTETMDDLKLTQQFIKTLNPNDLLIKIFVPFPGSALYKYVVENHLFTPPQKLEDWAISWSKVNYQISQVAPETLNRLLKSIMTVFYIRGIPANAKAIFFGLFQNEVSLPRLIFRGIQNIAGRND